jgi:PEP-CTERM motif
MSRSVRRLSIKPLALAISLGLLTLGAAHADTQVSATASYVLDNGTSVTLADPSVGTSTGSVDVLAFPWSTSTSSNAGIHTYGSPSGDFGSRSSGAGVYDVTGLFKLTQTITNTSATAQQANFNFYITPGLLQNSVRSDLGSNGYYVSAGIQFNIKRDGGSVWASGATLTTDASGTQYQQTGADIYTLAGPTEYTIGGQHLTADLGVINAGQTISLEYTLSTFARGNAPGTGNYTVPSRTISVPEQSVFHPEYTYQQWVYDGNGGYGGYGGYGSSGYGGYGGYGGHWETVTVPAWTEVIPSRTVTTESYTSFNEPSGSHASSGDPFQIIWTGDPVPFYDPSSSMELKPSASPFSVAMTPVPEPESLALALAGLGVVGWMARRRAR